MRGSQEAFRGLQRRCCDWDPVLTPFWGRHKSMISRKRYCIFRDFAFFNPDSIWDPILDPPGLRFGSFLGCKIAETSLGILLGALKSRSRALSSGLGGLQEPSKTPPRGLHAAKTAPRALQQAPGSILESFWSFLGSNPGAILESFWDKFDYTDVGRLLRGRRQMIART